MAVERFLVEATHIMMFARAIGDLNPVYTDPDSPEAAEFGGVIAPPTFTTASAQFDPENPLRPNPGQAWFGSAREPSGVRRETPAGSTPSSISSITGPFWPARC